MDFHIEAQYDRTKIIHIYKENTGNTGSQKNTDPEGGTHPEDPR